jgi:hypothetical protein
MPRPAFRLPPASNRANELFGAEIIDFSSKTNCFIVCPLLADVETEFTLPRKTLLHNSALEIFIG